MLGLLNVACGLVVSAFSKPSTETADTNRVTAYDAAPVTSGGAAAAAALPAVLEASLPALSSLGERAPAAAAAAAFLPPPLAGRVTPLSGGAAAAAAAAALPADLEASLSSLPSLGERAPTAAYGLVVSAFSPPSTETADTNRAMAYDAAPATSGGAAAAAAAAPVAAETDGSVLKKEAAELAAKTMASTLVRTSQAMARLVDSFITKPDTELNASIEVLAHEMAALARDIESYKKSVRGTTFEVPKEVKEAQTGFAEIEGCLEKAIQQALELIQAAEKEERALSIRLLPYREAHRLCLEADEALEILESRKAQLTIAQSRLETTHAAWRSDGGAGVTLKAYNEAESTCKSADLAFIKAAEGAAAAEVAARAALGGVSLPDKAAVEAFLQPQYQRARWRIIAATETRETIRLIAHFFTYDFLKITRDLGEGKKGALSMSGASLIGQKRVQIFEAIERVQNFRGRLA